MPDSNITKRALAQALKTLMSRTPFAKISVGDICTACGMSRKSFYYHFKDKYDIISWIFYREVAPIINTSQPEGNWAESLLGLCRYMQQNKAFYIKAFRIQGQNGFTECLLDFYASLVKSLLLNAQADQILDAAQIATISNFYASGLMGVVSKWAESGMNADPEPTIRILKALLSGEIFDKLLTLQQEA